MPKYRVKRHAVTQPLDESYRLIPLTQGQNAIVDIQDFERLNQFNWCAQWSPHTKSFYAIRGEGCAGRNRIVQMAREILACGPEEEADHVSHDTLDNRRNNLRKSTSSQNNSNQKLRSDNTSGFKGVSWSKLNKKWVVHISYKRKLICVGYFSSKEEAARAYDKAARKYHGDFAVLNFP